MSIIYPLPFPSSPLLRTFKLSAVDLVGEVVGEFDGSQQEQQWQGQWWELEGSWPPMKRAQAELVLSFLISLHGKYGTFTWNDPMATVPQGTAAGSPVANGTQAQRSNSLTTRGWTPNQAGVLLPGDYIQPLPTAGNPPRLYKNLTVANADASGFATLDIFPSIREALADATLLLVKPATSLADGDVVTSQGCLGTFRLIENLRDWSVDVTTVYGISFKAKEAI